MSGFYVILNYVRNKCQNIYLLNRIFLRTYVAGSKFSFKIHNSPLFSTNLSYLYPTALSKTPHVRFYATGEKLTHVTADGKARMVDVGGKASTVRTATAQGTITVTKEIIKLIVENQNKKGDVLTVAHLAGILAAKKTSDLIPLCHNLSLNSVKIFTSLDEQTNSLIVSATVTCDGKTGVEMEALTAVSLATLTIYDMCKAVSYNMVISDIKLMEKDGGTTGHFIRAESPKKDTVVLKKMFVP